ncbi:MAG: BlaI/MecI/CopY family transcriptional regulator [Paraclostridium sp.]
MKKLPVTELKIMKFIWSQNTEKVASKDIAAYMLKEFFWLKGTTGKVLSRLVEKEFLHAEKQGRNTIYEVLINNDQYIKFETKEFFNLVHDKSIFSFVSALSEEEDISDKELKYLEEWIKSRS